MALRLVLLAALAATAQCLRATPRPGTTRRGILSALPLAVPAAVHAVNNPFDKGEVVYKRGAKGPSDKKRMRPDGFGGYVERDDDDIATTPLYKRVGDAITADAPAAPAPTAPVAAAKERVAAAKPAPAKSAASTAPTGSSAKALTVDELIANSIQSKEDALGMSLSDGEKAAIAAQVRALMAK